MNIDGDFYWQLFVAIVVFVVIVIVVGTRGQIIKDLLKLAFDGVLSVLVIGVFIALVIGGIALTWMALKFVGIFH